MKVWQEVQLKDISIKITKGTTPTTMGYEFQSEGVNFIKAESVTRDGIIDSSTFAFIESKAHENLKRSQIQERDILLTIAGIYLGKVGLVKSNHLPANTNQAVAIIRLNRTFALPEYVRYFLFEKSTTIYLNQLCPQSAQPNLNLTQLGRLKFKLPPLKIQKKIAAILSAYDDLSKTINVVSPYWKIWPKKSTANGLSASASPVIKPPNLKKGFRKTGFLGFFQM